MAWDSSKPGDSEKIRSLGTVIRPNWESIEVGEDANAMVNTDSVTWLRQYSVALIERDGRAANDTPTTESNTLFHYCRQDATNSVAEGFIKTPAGSDIQITQAARLGSDVTSIAFENLSNDDGTTLYDERNLVAYWAYINASGAIQAQSGGLTCVQDGGGNAKYTISFTVDQSSINYGVHVTALLEAGGSNPNIGLYHTNLVGSFVVDLVNQNGTIISGGAPFTVTVYGGRPT